MTLYYNSLVHTASSAFFCAICVNVFPNGAPELVEQN